MNMSKKETINKGLFTITVKLLIILFLLLDLRILPQKYVYEKNIDEKWVDSILSSLTIDEKIAQLIIIDVHPTHKNIKEHLSRVRKLVRDYGVGGIILFKGGPYQYANIINELQDISKIPLLVTIDAEWGLAMRMDSVVSFPMAMALSATEDEELIYEVAKAIAKQLKYLGIHINFAPVVDINNNPENPVINVRSFGDNKLTVSTNASYFLKGLHEENILAVAKHFPGHGNTNVDSHLDLPIIKLNYKNMDTLELFPYKYLLKYGLSGIMVAHISLPLITKNEKLPATLSNDVIMNILREKLKFNGIVFTDALNMKGITKYFSLKDISVLSLLADNDVLLYPEDPELTIQYIKQAIQDGIICEDIIDNKVRKILKLKYWVGLHNCLKVDTFNLYQKLNSSYFKLLSKKSFLKSISVIKNDKEILPLKYLDTLSICYLNFFGDKTETFQKFLKFYANIRIINYNEFSEDSLIELLKNYNLIITSFHQLNRYAIKTFNVNPNYYSFLEKVSLKQNSKIILCLFTSPYILYKLPYLKNLSAIILCYENNNLLQELVPQVMFGGLPYCGKLPIFIDEKYNDYFANYEVNRLSFAYPEELGLNSFLLEKKIDSIIETSIKNKVFPGCQILLAKDSKVFFYKAYGNLFYDSLTNSLSTIYDLASITKSLATTLAIMYLYDNKKVDIKAPLKQYLDYVIETNKANIRIQDILLHQARLKAWIPFYKIFINDTVFFKKNFSTQYSETYKIKVAENLFANNFVLDTIKKIIINSELLPTKKYLYSDLGFYFLKEIVERITNSTIDQFCDSIFYKKLGSYTTTYNPLNKFSKNLIAPTEYDKTFRKQLIWGYVHDPGAALYGGVQGHAGLFSNAIDLAKILQMLLNGGKYGYYTFLSQNTINYFTSYHSKNNRRALGFDKPEPELSKDSPVSRKVSFKTYGHLGFTGTCFWVDPKYKLIYIFLSNRIHPSADNNLINKENIRNKVLEVVYEALKQK